MQPSFHRRHFCFLLADTLVLFVDVELEYEEGEWEPALENAASTSKRQFG